MAHEFESGFFHREPAWHGLGTVVDTPPATWEEARALAGLDWEPIKSPVFAQDIVVGDDGTPGEVFTPIDGWERVVRSDNGATLYIGPSTYELINHSDMGLLMNAIMGDTKRHWETGGSLQGGKRVWCLVELGDPIEIKGDPSPTRRYVVILNAHDGSLACQAITTMVRVVCHNTYTAAEYDATRTGLNYKFQHSSGWRRKLDVVAKEARAALTGADKQVDVYREFAEVLTSKPVTKEQADRFIDELIYPTKEEHKIGARARDNVIAHRDEVRTILGSPTCEGVRGTAYGLLQAAGEWADHERPYQDAETKFGRSVITLDRFKKRGRVLALAAADGKL